MVFAVIEDLGLAVGDRRRDRRTHYRGIRSTDTRRQATSSGSVRHVPQDRHALLNRATVVRGATTGRVGDREFCQPTARGLGGLNVQPPADEQGVPCAEPMSWCRSVQSAVRTDSGPTLTG
jgi:hypothetical protein